MENGLQIFENATFGKVRVITIEGEPWFVGKDVCECLGYKDTNNALKQHVEEGDKRGWRITTPFGSPITTVINEPAIYSLIFSSRLLIAKAFKDWVFHEALPTIRKTGSYNKAPIAMQEKLEAGKIILQTAGIEGNQLTLALDKLYKFETGTSLLAITNTQLVAPQQTQLYTPTQLGKMSNPPVSAKFINAMLADLGLQVKNEGLWEITEKGLEKGGTYLDTGKAHNNGTPVRQLKWPADVLNLMN